MIVVEVVKVMMMIVTIDFGCRVRGYMTVAEVGDIRAEPWQHFD